MDFLGHFCLAFLVVTLLTQAISNYREKPVGAVTTLQACARAHNVYECEWVAVPKPIESPKNAQ